MHRQSLEGVVEFAQRFSRDRPLVPIVPKAKIFRYRATECVSRGLSQTRQWCLLFRCAGYHHITLKCQKWAFLHSKVKEYWTTFDSLHKHTLVHYSKLTGLERLVLRLLSKESNDNDEIWDGARVLYNKH